jgi:hypothetical protein
MNRYKRILLDILRSYGGLALVGAAVLYADQALAQVSPKAAGELVMAKEVTINGQPAVAGLTLFSNSRLKTAMQGAAAVNLGRQGRFELGPKTEMALRLSSGAVGGDLTAGNLQVNVPANVKLSIDTGKGVISTDGTQATSLTIESAGETLRVRMKRGEAIVAANGKSGRVCANEELSIDRGRDARSNGWSRRMLGTGLAGSAAAAGSSMIVGASATSPGRISGLPTLINSGINSSISGSTLRQANLRGISSSSVSCRNFANVACKLQNSTN